MLRNLADWEIRRQLETVPGVASVRIKGGLVEEIQVEINEAQLTRLGLTFGQINQRLAAENINQAGGQLQEGDEALIVRAVNEFQTVEEIGEIIISSRGEVPVRLHGRGHGPAAFQGKEDAYADQRPRERGDRPVQGSGRQHGDGRPGDQGTAGRCREGRMRNR